MIEVDNKFSQYTLYIRRTEHSSVSNRVDTQWRKGEAKSTDCLKPETSIEHSTKRLLPYLGKKNSQNTIVRHYCRLKSGKFEICNIVNRFLYFRQSTEKIVQKRNELHS